MTTEELPLDEHRLRRRAVQYVVGRQFGSTTYIQRKLGIGHDKARRLMNLLEENGIVGPPRGTVSRDVLVRADQVREVLQSMGLGEDR